MQPRISSATLCRLIRCARARPVVEICGLLRGTNGAILHAPVAANVAGDPTISFEIAPDVLLRAHRLGRHAGAFAILGHFHSHPNGRAVPSPRDADAAAPDGRLWLILTCGTARMWRAVPHGALHDRFDPVAFDIMIGKRVEKAARGVAWTDDDPGSLAIEYFLD